MDPLVARAARWFRTVGQDAARAEARSVDVVAAGDLARWRRWPQDPLRVVVHSQPAFAAVGLRQLRMKTCMPRLTAYSTKLRPGRRSRK